jgi:hypothetical protein
MCTVGNAEQRIVSECRGYESMNEVEVRFATDLLSQPPLTN